MNDTRWQAVLNRDTDTTPPFLYAVKTTGIYCRPGCASRRPNRKNVLFFDTPAQAEEAGFRPCKRCRPDDPAHADLRSHRVIRACRSLEANDPAPTLTQLAAEAGLSPSHFQRLFTLHVGISPKEYVQALRDERVRSALTQGSSVTRAIFDAGFGSASRFYEKATDTLGMDAKAYKRGGKGLTISYGQADSFLGPVLAGFTDKGVCAIELGDNEKTLIKALRKRFPEAVIQPDAELTGLVHEIAAFIKTPEQGLDLPLDIQGTAFQQRVWKALTAINPGETRTYSEVAEAIGNPGAIRAVATACAANPLAVAVPCHRVVRKSGDLAGYRSGIARKKALLENEKK